MTCQITSLLKEKAVTASDSAVTVNNSKAWTNVEKTFKLSDNPPINIMINGSPTINNFPVKLLIDEFEKIVKSDNIEDIAEEFLDFIGKTVPKTNIENFIEDKISEFKILYSDIEKEDYPTIVELTKELNIEIPPYVGNKYEWKFEELIQHKTSKKLKNELKNSFKKIFCEYLITKSTGVVITGISTDDHFPSYISFNIILNNNGKIEIMNKESDINCNISKFKVYGQNDVIDAYLTGIDENFESELYYLIKKIMTPTKSQLTLLKKEVKLLKNINRNQILKNVELLPTNDLYEFLETLIKSTENKRKLISKIDSVGGNVHIEKITKNNGILMKEKNI